MTYDIRSFHQYLQMNLVYLKKHWFCYMIWRWRRKGGRCLSAASLRIYELCGLNLEALLVWYMIKRSLWRTHNFKGSTQTVGFQCSSQSLISSSFHKWILISLAAYARIISCLIVQRRDGFTLRPGIYSRQGDRNRLGRHLIIDVHELPQVFSSVTLTHIYSDTLAIRYRSMAPFGR